MPLTLDDFDYSLPTELIAQAPLPVRSSSRLLRLEGGLTEDRRFCDLTELLAPGDLLVINDTRVLHARLFGIKESGGRVEVLVERLLGGRELLAQVRASKPPRAGSKMRLEEAVEVEVIAREGEFYRLRVDGMEDVAELLERHGRLPLPPYIERAVGDADESRYQTVYSRERGSVAAPTAGLHFDQAMIESLRSRGCAIATVTLHVGAGTFQPVRVQDLSRHKMHSERYRLPQETADAIAHTRRTGGRVVAVGTTTLRTLESAALAGELQAGEAETDLFILPGFRFRVVDALITNFHLPKSTLLMLVSAFGGTENIRRAYAYAIDQGYRFFSYGDAMFLTRQPDEV